MKCQNCKTKMNYFEGKYICPKCGNIFVMNKDLKYENAAKSNLLIEQENKKYNPPAIYRYKHNDLATIGFVFSVIDPIGLFSLLFSLIGFILAFTRKNGLVLSIFGIIISLAKIILISVGLYYLYNFIMETPALKESWDIIINNLDNPSLIQEEFVKLFKTLFEEIKNSIFG